jgi:hypothetical protein
MALGLALALITFASAARGPGRSNVRMSNICPKLPAAVQTAQSQTATFAQG